MATHMPEHRWETVPDYDDRRATITALLCVVLIDAGIIGLFMFITWAVYAAG